MTVSKDTKLAWLDEDPPGRWLIIQNHVTGRPVGGIPQTVAERVGVDCSPLDSGGTVFLDAAQRAAIHDHAYFRPIASP